MIKRSLLLLVASAFALTLLFSPGGEQAANAGVSPSMDAMSLDFVTTGNTASAIGANDDCIQAAAGAMVDIDVTADNIPTTNKLFGFYGTIAFSGAALTIQTVDIDFKIGVLAGSSPLDASGALPDSSGAWTVSAADLTTTPEASSESGDGVLARVTVEVNGALTSGLYNMALTFGTHTDPNNDTWDATVLNGGRIAVGTSTCADPFKQGDVDCNNLVNSIDALKVLRSNASLPVAQTEPCANIGTGASPNQMGNVDCSTTGVNSIDALKVLRFNASLAYTQTNPCVDIGETIVDNV